MPPKKVEKKAEKGQQKALEKQKQKVIEEKTFGLKNKNKSKSVQKYIKGLQNSAKSKPINEQALVSQEYHQKEERKKQQQQAALLASLYKSTQQIKKIDSDVSARIISPATIKAEQQIDLYIDQREQKHSHDANINHVQSMHPGTNSPLNMITCKHFIEAVEKKQYGWFWVCPNGGDECKYSHCLPLGQEIVSSKQEVSNETEELSLEEKLDRERLCLQGEGTRLTRESFEFWNSQRRNMEDEYKIPSKQAQKKIHDKNISGRALFSLNPSIFIDDIEAAETINYQNDRESTSQSDEIDEQDIADLMIHEQQLFLEESTL